MTIKKCKFCKTRMNKVIYGMPTAEDFASRDPFTEFRGCFVTDPAEDWRCSHCDSKIIPRLTPKVGVCLEEAPQQLNNAIQLFVSRINNIAVDYYLGKVDGSENAAELKCVAPINFGEFDWPDAVIELTSGLGQQHKQTGDFLSVRICPNLEWQIRFHGSSQVVARNDLQSFQDEVKVLVDIDVPDFTNLHTKLDDLVTGKHLLHQVVKGVLRIQPSCNSESCDHDKDGPWEDLPLLDETLSQPNSRLSADFPTITAPYPTKKENA